MHIPFVRVQIKSLCALEKKNFEVRMRSVFDRYLNNTIIPSNIPLIRSSCCIFLFEFQIAYFFKLPIPLLISQVQVRYYFVAIYSFIEKKSI